MIEKATIRHVIFDVDGTMINPHEGLVECVKATIKKLNYKMLDEEVLNSFIGPPIQNSFQKYYNLRRRVCILIFIKFPLFPMPAS